MTDAIGYDVVIPTTGRPSLARLLRALAHCPDPLPERILLVDDRPNTSSAGSLVHTTSRPALLPSGLPARIVERLGVARSGGRGPAAARNVGWRAASEAWVAFLDDDVVPPRDWTVRLEEDLRAAGPRVAGTQARIRVPLPVGRRPTDWERNVAGLERARWATADLAYRREALAQVGGFDERFARNYREDADLGLRISDAGWEIVQGEREIVHPVGPASRWVSLKAQAGNADDALMRRLHGREWRTRAGAPPGRLPRHAATTTAGTLSLAALASGHRRTAAVAGVLWATGAAELTWARVAPGSRTPAEIATMALTSAALPFLATWHRLRGPRRPSGAPPQPPQAVLLDRDGTLAVDVPYNGDPEQVRPMPFAAQALDLLREAGIPTAVVSNQSGIGRGILHEDQVEAVNARVETELGPLGPFVVCPHAPGEGCGCRKPRPGLIVDAARQLDVDPAGCAVIGDIGADVEAARAAGARGILVPTPHTRREEISAADEVAPDLLTAVRMLLQPAEATCPANGAEAAAPLLEVPA